MELTRERKHWSPDEDKHLSRLVELGQQDEQISIILQRSIKSIIHRRCKLGLQKREEKKWSNEEIKNILEGKKVAGRSKTAIKCKRHRLKKIALFSTFTG